ncbi:hypothetical protein AKJ65_08230 [candidate division MSBL1 archaeon SCGC-AAA259E19]|uniref:Uncharacterized protein n=1 Tax=candidate division MSBL1 archaeon SCGC-AAA259E19 TaxID=1698264 RepID=A0A133UCR2_9EURY|nr:hypothetical protein AKJ65_08230 [candidate division MSBL1 archaeon SCGC-AAA259E19]
MIFAKVASIIEAFPDINGEYASVDTNFLYDTDKDIKYYGGVLNIKVANFLYAALFGALRMRGGDFKILRIFFLKFFGASSFHRQ